MKAVFIGPLAGTSTKDRYGLLANSIAFKSARSDRDISMKDPALNPPRALQFDFGGAGFAWSSENVRARRGINGADCPMALVSLLIFLFVAVHCP